MNLNNGMKLKLRLGYNKLSSKIAENCWMRQSNVLYLDAFNSSTFHFTGIVFYKTK